MRRPLGQAQLTISRHGTDIRTWSHNDLHPGKMRQTIYPMSHYLKAMSGMTHADMIQARILIRSRPVFTNPEVEAIDLLELSTAPDGLVSMASRVVR